MKKPVTLFTLNEVALGMRVPGRVLRKLIDPGKVTPDFKTTGARGFFLFESGSLSAVSAALKNPS